MATWTLNFQSAGLFDLLRRRRSAPAAGPEPRADPGYAVSRRRAEAMRGLFPKLSSWMAHHGHLTELSEVDRYLSQSMDIFDLERRIREIERRGSASRWFQ
jgi:hypothetical protein